MSPEIIQSIGSLGALCILFGFIMNKTNRWKNNSVKYDAVNLVGSGLLVWYAQLLSSHPFFVLNGVWLIVSLSDLVKDLKKKR